MEYLAPSHLFVLHLIEDFRAGKTLRTSVHSFLIENHTDFTKKLLQWSMHWEKGELKEFKNAFLNSSSSIYQEALFDLLQLSISGASILEPLEALELEMRAAAKHQLEAHLGTLPFKMLIPLLTLLFPALLMMIVGPLFYFLIQEVQ